MKKVAVAAAATVLLGAGPGCAASHEDDDGSPDLGALD